MAEAPTTPQPTAAQLQLQADNARRVEDAAKREQEQRDQASGWLQRQLPDFSLGGLFEIGIFAAIAFFVMKIPAVQKFVGDLIGNLSPEWQTNIIGLFNKIGIDMDIGKALNAMPQDDRRQKLSEQGISNEVLDIIDPNGNPAVFNSLLNLVSNANNGKVTMNGFTSPETITALMQQNPAMARALVVAAMKGDDKGQPSSTTLAISASVKSIIASPQLDVLLNSANRANTLRVFAAALPPDMQISEAGLGNLITQGLDANGKPTPALRKLLTDAVDSAASKNYDAVLADAYNILGSAGLVNLIDENKLTNDAAKYAVTTVQRDPKARAAYEALATAMGSENAQKFLTVFNSGDNAQNNALDAVKLLLTKENIKALPQAVALLNALPGLAEKLPIDQANDLRNLHKFLTPSHITATTAIVNTGVANPVALVTNFTVNGQFSMDHAVDSLLDPDVRKQLKQAGTANVAALVADQNPLLNSRNLDAILKFGDALDGGNAANSPNTGAVMRALAKVTTGTSMKDAFKGLSGAQIAAVFSVPQNRAAFASLLDPKTGLVGTTPGMQSELALLRQDFDKGNGVGLSAILSDARSAQYLIDQNGSPSRLPNAIAQNEHIQSLALMFESSWGRGNWVTLEGPLAYGKNRDILIALGKVLGGSTQTTANAPAPSLTPVPPAPLPANRPERVAQQH